MLPMSFQLPSHSSVSLPCALFSLFSYPFPDPERKEVLLTLGAAVHAQRAAHQLDLGRAVL